MTEKEKMLQGEWHDANFDARLLEERQKSEPLRLKEAVWRPVSPFL